MRTVVPLSHPPAPLARDMAVDGKCSVVAYINISEGISLG